MVEVEFTEDYLNCYKKGDKRTVRKSFAKVLVFYEVAKIVSGPSKNKMIESPVMEKSI